MFLQGDSINSSFVCWFDYYWPRLIQRRSSSEAFTSLRRALVGSGSAHTPLRGRQYVLKKRIKKKMSEKLRTQSREKLLRVRSPNRVKQNAHNTTTVAPVQA